MPLLGERSIWMGRSPGLGEPARDLLIDVAAAEQIEVSSGAHDRLSIGGKRKSARLILMMAESARDGHKPVANQPINEIACGARRRPGDRITSNPLR